MASRGVRVPWGASQPLHHTCALLATLSPGVVCCLATAALLWGCPLPLALQNEQKIHLAKIGGGARPVRKGVSGHRLALRNRDVGEFDGVPVTSPARTWLDLAAVLDLEDLVVAADYFICSQASSFGPKKDALCSLGDLLEQVQSTPGARGIRKARQALELCRVGADSAPETRLRLAIGRLGLPEPTLRYVVQDASGQELAWPDVAFPDFKVAVNYDGRHHVEERQRESDIRRDESIAAIGWASVTVRSALTDAPTAYWTRSSGRDGGSRGEVSASTVRQSAEISPLDAGGEGWPGVRGWPGP